MTPELTAISLAKQYKEIPVLIHGPQGCGKSRNAAQLAQRFGKAVVLDYDGTIPIDKYPADAIVLSYIELPGSMHFDEAMRLAGISMPTESAALQVT